MAIRFYLGSQDNQVEFVLTNPLYPMPIDFNHANSCKEGCPLLALTCPWGWSLNLFVDELHDNWNPWGAPQEFHLQLRCQCFGRLSFEWHLLPGFPKPCRDARCHQQDCFLFLSVCDLPWLDQKWDIISKHVIVVLTFCPWAQPPCPPQPPEHVLCQEETESGGRRPWRERGWWLWWGWTWLEKGGAQGWWFQGSWSCRSSWHSICHWEHP